MDFVQAFLQNGSLDRKKIAEIERNLKTPGASPEALLLQAGISLEDILKTKGQFYDVPTRTIGKDEQISFDTLQLIPEESARHYGLVPLAVKDNVLEVGITDPDNLEARDALSFISSKLEMPYKIFLITDTDFNRIIALYKGLSGEVGKALGELEVAITDENKKTDKDTKRGVSIEEETAITETASDATSADAPVTKIVATILRHASESRASDIHIEPFINQTRVRFRVDGLLSTNITLPLKVHPAVVARIKVLSNMRLDEKRKPQDGRFSARVAGKKVDFRVSTFPTYYGEKVVMRILGASAQEIKLESLGFSPRSLELIRTAIKKPYGLILLSGPTGSGKSTTLYAILNEIDREGQNVLSLEDPIEYTIAGVSQSQVHPEIGYTFANGLRTTLRQDPNIIMVGEIRDNETADLAVQASLTGHLVLSTIHTNNAVGIVPRLLDMKIEPYLIPAVLVLGMAQRLVQTLPPGGGQKMPVEDGIAAMLKDEFADLPEESRSKIPPLKEVYRVKSTPEYPTGTKGRTAVSEVFEMVPELERAILARKSEEEMFAVVRKNGMFTMKEDAIMKSVEGIIPFEEVNALGGQFELSDIDVSTSPSSPQALTEEGDVPSSEESHPDIEV